jgi:hypothetical protein
MENRLFSTLSVISERSELSGIGIRRGDSVSIPTLNQKTGPLGIPYLIRPSK